MKIQNIKSILPAAMMCLAVGSIASSCTGDLNTSPINSNIVQTFDQAAVFAKLYSSLAVSGQQGPSGEGDLNVDDEGMAGFYRLMWNMQELPTDEAACTWTDNGTPELDINSWTSSNAIVGNMYSRCTYDITMCNHFLDNTSDTDQSESTTDLSKDTKHERAEARFLRVLNYYYLLDFFGNVPFSTTVMTTNPPRIERAALYRWMVEELKTIQGNMYAAKAAAYGRADVAADYFLLSRLYLNATVYTGTENKANWDSAAIYSKKVIDSGFKLASKYQYLFEADNGYGDGSVNDATNEIIFPIQQDGVKTNSYSGSLFLIASTHNSDMPSWGSTEGWAGNRARYDLLEKFFSKGVTTTDESTLTSGLATLAGDSRALFFGKDRTQKMTSLTTFKNGFSVTKWTNLRADGQSTSDTKFTDTDIPLFRAAEAYLTYAEALTRANGGVATQTAIDAVNVVRKRAGATVLTSLTLDQILDERCREFYFEGQRRTDLIRFGYFGGTNQFLWEWKGGSVSGTTFDSHYNLYPIPDTDLNANSNLKQNSGY
jgi:hypothetical protein